MYKYPCLENVPLCNSPILNFYKKEIYIYINKPSFLHLHIYKPNQIDIILEAVELSKNILLI